MASVVVSLADATQRRLPLVSVRSGRDADGYLGVPVGLGLVDRIVWGVTQRSTGVPLAYVPLTESEFERVLRLRRGERSGAVNAIAFIGLAVVLARFPLLFPLGLAISGLSVAIHVAARFGLARVLPDVSSDRDVVTLAGVHRDFAARVARGERRYT